MSVRTRGQVEGRRAARAGTRRPGERRTKPAEQRRGDLLTAAERLFLAQGLEATTVEQITAAAGVAKGSFYLQFASKEELVEALRQRFLASYLEEVEAVIAEIPADQHAARLGVWAAVTISTFLDQAALHDLLFLGPRDYVHQGTGGNAAVRQLRGLLEAGTRDGAWSLPDPLDAASFLFHGLHGLLDTALARQPRPARSAIEESAMALVERLVLASD